jgi:hypothetical protein
MKKFLLIFAVFVFTTVEANAATSFVKFNNAGAPVTIARGGGNPVSVRTMSQGGYSRIAHPTLPARPAIPYYRSRYVYAPPMPYYNYPTPIHTAAAPQPSRLNSSTAPNIPTKSYTMNGVTYYN